MVRLDRKPAAFSETGLLFDEMYTKKQRDRTDGTLRYA